MKGNKLILNNSKYFLEARNIMYFTEEVNKIELSANDDQIIQSIDSIDTYMKQMKKKYTKNKKLSVSI